MSSLLQSDSDFGGRQRSLSESLHLDLPLLMGLLTLSVTSLFVLYSASGQNMDVVIRQGVRFIVEEGKSTPIPSNAGCRGSTVSAYCCCWP